MTENREYLRKLTLFCDFIFSDHPEETGTTSSMTEGEKNQTMGGGELETVDQDSELVPWWDIVPEQNTELDLSEALESDKHVIMFPSVFFNVVKFKIGNISNVLSTQGCKEINGNRFLLHGFSNHSLLR